MTQLDLEINKTIERLNALSESTGVFEVLQKHLEELLQMRRDAIDLSSPVPMSGEQLSRVPMSGEQLRAGGWFMNKYDNDDIEPFLLLNVPVFPQESIGENMKAELYEGAVSSVDLSFDEFEAESVQEIHRIGNDFFKGPPPACGV